MSDPCGAMHLLLQADLDGELDAAAAAGVAAHVEGCPDCAALQARLAALSAEMRAAVTRYPAPPGVRRMLIASQPARRRLPWRHGASFGAGMAVAAAVAIAVLPQSQAGVPDVVAAHIRALQPGHLTDVTSTDQHTVKPWFDGRLDYAPPVRDFAKERFPLVGGRLDYLAGRPVAALVYSRDKHLIDVFVWPGASQDDPGTAAQGYNIVSWYQDGLNYRLVSDLNRLELGDLARLLRAP